jgi:hypothetical protein
MGYGCGFYAHAYPEEWATIDVFVGRLELGTNVVCYQVVPRYRFDVACVIFHLLFVRLGRLDECEKAGPLQLVSTRRQSFECNP